jgi:L-fucose isomerase
LYRVRGDYRMAVIPGETIRMTADDLAEFARQRGKHQLPTAFVRVECDLDHLVEEFGSNHVSGVAGHWVKELEQLCPMLGIEPVVMDRNF